MIYDIEYRAIVKLDVEKALICLKPREREIIEIRFLSGEKLSFRKIILKYGLKNPYGKPISKSRLHQIESKALRKLKRCLEKMKY